MYNSLEPHLGTFLLEKDFIAMKDRIQNDEEKKFFMFCYKQNVKNEPTYFLNADLSYNEKWKLQDIFVKNTPDLAEDHKYHIYCNIIAKYFWGYREEHRRIGGDERDDFYKAEYLYKLIFYFKEREKPEIFKKIK